MNLLVRGRCVLRRNIAYGLPKSETKRNIEDRTWDWWQAEWNATVDVGSWTKRLIPNVRSWVRRSHGSVSYHLAQFLTGHGCFQQYLYRFARVSTPECVSCGYPGDCVEHTFFCCDRWYTKRRALEVFLGCQLTPQTIVQKMLESKRIWDKVEDYVTSILQTKEFEERNRQGINLN